MTLYLTAQAGSRRRSYGVASRTFRGCPAPPRETSGAPSHSLASGFPGPAIAGVIEGRLEISGRSDLSPSSNLSGGVEADLNARNCVENASNPLVVSGHAQRMTHTSLKTAINIAGVAPRPLSFPRGPLETCTLHDQKRLVSPKGRFGNAVILVGRIPRKGNPRRATMQCVATQHLTRKKEGQPHPTNLPFPFLSRTTVYHRHYAERTARQGSSHRHADAPLDCRGGNTLTGRRRYTDERERPSKRFGLMQGSRRATSRSGGGYGLWPATAPCKSSPLYRRHLGNPCAEKVLQNRPRQNNVSEPALVAGVGGHRQGTLTITGSNVRLGTEMPVALSSFYK